MPYIADPDDTLVQQIGRALVAYAPRPADVGDETLRIPRSKLYDAIAPTMFGLRREDFNEAIRRLTEQTDAIREATGTGKRADVVLTRVTDDIGDYEEPVYDDFEDYIEPEAVAALLAEQGHDVTTPIPSELLIRKKQREPVRHDQEAPRKCTRCGETKTLDNFHRRSKNPNDREFYRWQSYCVPCTAQALAANRPYDDRVREERYGKNGKVRPGARGPRAGY